MTPARQYIREWLAVPVLVTRAKILVLSWILGLFLACGVYVYFHGQAADEDARQELYERDRQLADALARLKTLEQPSDAELKARLARAIRGLTPEQARQILRRAFRGLDPGERSRLLKLLEGGGRSGGGNPPPGPPGPPQ